MALKINKILQGLLIVLGLTICCVLPLMGMSEAQETPSGQEEEKELEWDTSGEWEEGESEHHEAQGSAEDGDWDEPTHEPKLLNTQEADYLTAAFQDYNQTGLEKAELNILSAYKTYTADTENFLNEVRKTPKFKGTEGFMPFVAGTIGWANLFDEKQSSVSANKDVQKLLNDRHNNKNRTIKQLRSLNQYDDSIKKTYGLACGFFVIYNIIHVVQFLANNDFSGLDKLNIDIKSSSTVLGTPGSPNETLANFKTWMAGQEQTLLSAIKKNPSLDEYKKPTGYSEEANELAGSHIQYLCSQDLEKKYHPQIAILGNDFQDVGFKSSTASARTTFDGALYQKDNVYEKIKRFRKDGTPLLFIFLQKGHWRPLIMTTHGLYLANSYGNTSNVDDFHIKKLYDFFLFGKLEEEEKQQETKKEEGNTAAAEKQAPSTASPLSTLKESLKKLAAALATLREKLAKITR